MSYHVIQGILALKPGSPYRLSAGAVQVPAPHQQAHCDLWCLDGVYTFIYLKSSQPNLKYG